MAVRRFLAVFAVQAMVLSITWGSFLHVHEYVGHDHPEHHHGPASHEHQHSALGARHHPSHGVLEDHPAMEAESCDPGRHAVAASTGCVPVSQVHVDLADVPGPANVVPVAPIRSAAPVTDVRVHGPPSRSRIPSRAPPLTLHA
jgi:hypothetical protein